MSIHTDLKSMKEIAKFFSMQHKTKYTIIILNPDENGEFSFSNGSTYEYVQDSYFEKQRENVKVLCNTDDY
jgi:hypothetical protein